MKKFKKNDFKNIGLLISFILLFVIVLLCFGYAFGSEIDWANQHIVFPEYFRFLFYKTHNLIPNFSFNLGMGQNIFYISYYGLLSPIVLLSYILPFIPMYIYMIIASIISLIGSVILFYRWILNKYNSKIALIASILFLLNSTFFYHFHRHIMFVIYMPFLLIALSSIDKYFTNKKVLSLVISTFLLIMTSYYFGAYGCIVLFIYTIYLLLKNKQFDYIKLGKVVYYLLLAVLLSSVLLLPTLYALLEGRIETTVTSINVLSIISPSYNFNYTFYNSYYSWGLSFIYILAIIFGFVSKKKNRVFISTIMSLIIVFPIFSYILNGGMYVDGKCYLPFLPLALLQVCDFIEEYYNRRIVIKNYYKIIFSVLVFLIICSFLKTGMYFLIVDAVLTLLFFNKINEFKNRYFVFLPAIIISFASFVFSSFNEGYIKLKDLKEINDNKYYELTKSIDYNDPYRLSIEDNKRYTINKVYNVNSLRTSIYSSLENTNYYNQVRNVFQNETLNRDNFVLSQTSNVLFNIYSGTRYLISSNAPLIGYRPIKTIGNTTLYENEDVLPIIYASNKIMSKKEFDDLDYPNQIDALLNYIIVDNEEVENVYKSNIKKVNLKYKIKNMNNLEYFESNNHIIINANKNASLDIDIDPIKNKVLIIKFKMNKVKEGFACSSDIIVNGINNSLSCKDWKYNNNNNTFEYVLSSNDKIESINVKFSNDEFDISDIETYTIDYSILRELNNKVNKINFNIVNNKIVSDIDLKEQSYVKTTIPYEEKGYKVLIDNNETEIIKVDGTYIGFIVPDGDHTIEIVYYTPYLKEGLLLSSTGLIILLVTIYIRKKKDFTF